MLDVPDLLRRLGIDFIEQGTKLLANCPAHPDGTQRWMIRNEPGEEKHGRHRCLSCGYGGNAVGLVMTRLRLDYHAATVWIASSERAGKLAASVQIVERSVRRVGVTRPECVKFESLEDWPDRFAQYMLGRGVTAEQVERWGIGYVDDAPDRPALQSRVWIPVQNEAEWLAGWTARAVGGDPNRPKYMTSSLAEGTDRTVVLGEAFWSADQEVRDWCDIYVVEGPFDALALDRRGCMVATLEGSYLSPEVTQKLSTFRGMVLCVDPDRAGRKVAEQLLALRRHMEIVKFDLPDGIDVADMAVQHPDELDAKLDALRRHRG